MLDYIQRPGQLSCLKEFKEAVRGHEIVKVQCVGPATLIESGYEANDAVMRAANHIYAVLDGLDAKEVILFLDEPGLGQAGFDYTTLWSALFSGLNVTRGIHTCGNMDWDKLIQDYAVINGGVETKEGIKIISHDASTYNITLSPVYRNGRNGRRIAWGIKEGKNVKDFQEGDLLTAPCGLGGKGITIEDAERSLEMLLSVAEQVSH